MLDETNLDVLIEEEIAKLQELIELAQANGISPGPILDVLEEIKCD